MASGQRVLVPKDDPSAFITLSSLQAQLSRITATMDNATAASGVVQQIQTALSSMEEELQTIRSQLLLDEDRSLTSDQRAAAQANIDAALDQLNALANTSINGRHLLGGAADYLITGRDPQQVARLQVYATVPDSTPTITGSVTSAATQATLVHTGSGGKITADATFTLSGTRGSTSITVTNNEDLDDVAGRINDLSHTTGVTASVSGDDLTLQSVDYGSGASVAVDVTSGTFNVTGGDGDGTANGTDAVATINGMTGLVGDGNRFTVSQNGFRFQIEFQPGFTGSFDTITVSGQALRFALSPELDYPSTLAVPSLYAWDLGGISGRLDQLASGGALSGLDGNTSQAIRVVDEALGQLEIVQGVVDGFYNASVQTASSLLADFQEDLETTIEAVDGYDENEESYLLSKNLQLSANAVAGLAMLTEQRESLVALVELLAGLR